MNVQIVVLFSSFNLVVSKTCYWNSKCGQVYFGSKTIYDDVRGDVRDADGLEGCVPVGVWSLIRHGTRLPSKHNIMDMKNAAKLKNTIIQKNYFETQGQLCAQDMSNLQKWSWDTAIDTSPSSLTAEGYKELYSLGARLHHKFLPLLHNLDWYQFKPTLEQRTIESGIAFVDGLSQGNWNFEITNATNRDDILRPYYFCTKHREEVFNGKDSYNEIKKFHNTKEFQQTILSVQRRSGLDKLTAANVTGLYDLCRFNRAYSSVKSSPWCAIFSDDDLTIMEYLNDIGHYYRHGYGSSINAKLSGSTLKDLFQKFHKMVLESTSSFTGYFIHDSLLQMVYTGLGLFSDKNAITGLKRDPERKWRTSFMTPFAANFIAVLHKCTNQTDSHQIQFFINEVETQLCNSRTCSWKEFKNKFEPFVDSNLDFCDRVTPTTYSKIRKIDD